MMADLQTFPHFECESGERISARHAEEYRPAGQCIVTTSELSVSFPFSCFQPHLQCRALSCRPCRERCCESVCVLEHNVGAEYECVWIDRLQCVVVEGLEHAVACAACALVGGRSCRAPEQCGALGRCCCDCEHEPVRDRDRDAEPSASGAQCAPATGCSSDDRRAAVAVARSRDARDPAAIWLYCEWHQHATVSWSGSGSGRISTPGELCDQRHFAHLVDGRRYTCCAQDQHLRRRRRHYEELAQNIRRHFRKCLKLNLNFANYNEYVYSYFTLLYLNSITHGRLVCRAPVFLNFLTEIYRVEYCFALVPSPAPVFIVPRFFVPPPVV